RTGGDAIGWKLLLQRPGDARPAGTPRIIRGEALVSIYPLPAVGPDGAHGGDQKLVRFHEPEGHRGGALAAEGGWQGDPGREVAGAGPGPGRDEAVGDSREGISAGTGRGVFPGIGFHAEARHAV